MAKFFKKFLETKLVVKNSLLASELSAVFENNAAGTDLEAKAKYDNMLPLVRFAYEQECIHTSIITGKEKELLQTFLHIQKVIDNLNKLSEKATNDNERMWYKQQAYVGAMCLSELKEDPDLCHLCNFYQLLMDNWEGLKNWANTYILLSNLVKLGQGWGNDPEVVREFLQIKKTILSEMKE